MYMRESEITRKNEIRYVLRKKSEGSQSLQHMHFIAIRSRLLR